MYLIKTNIGKLFATHAENMMDAEYKFDEYLYSVSDIYEGCEVVAVIPIIDLSIYKVDEIIFF